MSFINNPLGSGGANPQFLGNLTSSIEALQKTEINRELRSLEQDKAWERDDRLRNQKLALEFSDISALDGIRQQQIDSFQSQSNWVNGHIDEMDLERITIEQEGIHAVFLAEGKLHLIP